MARLSCSERCWDCESALNSFSTSAGLQTKLRPSDHAGDSEPASDVASVTWKRARSISAFSAPQTSCTAESSACSSGPSAYCSTFSRSCWAAHSQPVAEAKSAFSDSYWRKLEMTSPGVMASSAHALDAKSATARKERKCLKRMWPQCQPDDSRTDE